MVVLKQYGPVFAFLVSLIIIVSVASTLFL